ncbi:MAG: phosphatidylglycerol lysyltransferase domain-containing protein [Asticcacaulis sp.]
MARLKEVSDGWLRIKDAKEKSYSLGCFKPDYMSLTPVAVGAHRRPHHGLRQPVADAKQTTLSLDLMRYDPESPPSTMEYLFLLLIDYARDNGYRHFSLGLAPLAGLDAKPLSSVWHKLAAVIYQLGGDIYNFEGLRAYKEKFPPRLAAALFRHPRPGDGAGAGPDGGGGAGFAQPEKEARRR